MNDSDIEITIKRYILLKKNTSYEKNDKDILVYRNILINICKHFHFFTKKIASTKTYNLNDIISKVLDSIEFIFLKKDTTIWDIDDNADEMYIIFLGQVNLYRFPEKNEKNGKYITELNYTLEKGYSFGEDCLRYINIEKKRKFLAKSKTPCILGKLNSKDYNKIYKLIISEEKNLINKFLEEINIFGNDFNAKFQRCLSIKYYNKNEYIFKQGDNYDTFYLIFKGNIRIFSDLKKFVKSKLENTFYIRKNNIERFTTSRQFEIKGSYNELIKYDIIDLGKGDFVGGIEYIYNYENYRYGAKCITDAIILKVDINLFKTILINAEKKLFNEKIEKQKEFIIKRMRNIKLGRERLKLNNNLLSKNKFIKTFLQSNPLSKKKEEKLDTYINCNVKPIKIKLNDNNIKTLNNTKNFFPKYIEEYKNQKNGKKSWKKSNLKLKYFFPNIDDKRKTLEGDIFSTLLSEKSIPKTFKKVYIIKNEENKRSVKKLKTEAYIERGQYTLEKIRNERRTPHRSIKNKLSLRKSIGFNNENIKEQFFLGLKKRYNKPQRNFYKYNSLRK